LGHPISNIPAPKGQGSYADYYFDEMINLLKEEFGISVFTYKTSELYKSGVFDDGIKLVLKNIDKMNSLYESITGVSKKFNSRPLQVICPHCGNMRTTRIINYQDEEVEIVCEDYKLRDVEFKGCGFHGYLSPYRGRSRLFWKLEWPIRWKALQIKVEGGRKDQNSDKGAREFSEKAYSLLFSETPPINLPYDFCYIRSANSQQINRFGVSVINALKFLPPQLFFYLLTKPSNTKVIDVNLESAKMIDIYRNYAKIFLDDDGSKFDLILDSLRFKNDIKVESRFDPLISCLNHYLHTSTEYEAWYLDLSFKTIDEEEKFFIRILLEKLEKINIWSASNIQECFRESIIKASFPVNRAYRLIYRLIINREAGLRIGVLLEKIDKEKILKYLSLY
jgi:lysyl-tRNA synthetase class I